MVRGRILALEPNAQNALTWFANNIVNRFVGTEAMTPNQRALWPRKVAHSFAGAGYSVSAVHYVDLRWSDSLGWVRGTYDLLTRWLPQRFRANKFLTFATGLPPDIYAFHRYTRNSAIPSLTQSR